MIRKQLYLEPRQERLLKRLARERGTSEAEIVREALDKLAESPPLSREEIWAQEVAFMRSRLSPPGPPRPRDWKREDAYAERMNRYERDLG